MTKSDDKDERANYLTRKISSILAAAGALFAQQPAEAGNARLGRIFQQAHTVSLQADERSAKKPSPLVLRSSSGSASAILIGHRSHSSHRSHQSHSSHYSSSSSGGSRRTSVPTPSYTNTYADDADPPKPLPTSKKKPKASKNELPDINKSRKQEQVPVEPPQPVDFNDPKQRFQVIGFARVGGVAHVTIMDLKTMSRERVAEGDMLAEYKVVSLDLKKGTVELHLGDEALPIMLKLKRKSGA